MDYELTQEQIEDFVSRTTSHNAKMVWNGAIEAAARLSEEKCGHDNAIRGLKK